MLKGREGDQHQTTDMLYESLFHTTSFHQSNKLYFILINLSACISWFLQVIMKYFLVQTVKGQS